MIKLTARLLVACAALACGVSPADATAGLAAMAADPDSWCGYGDHDADVDKMAPVIPDAYGITSTLGCMTADANWPGGYCYVPDSIDTVWRIYTDGQDATWVQRATDEWGALRDRVNARGWAITRVSSGTADVEGHTGTTEPGGKMGAAYPDQYVAQATTKGEVRWYAHCSYYLYRTTIEANSYFQGVSATEQGRWLKNLWDHEQSHCVGLPHNTVDQSLMGNMVHVIPGPWTSSNLNPTSGRARGPRGVGGGVLMSVQALFVQPPPAGIYPELLGHENCWDELRDARAYCGDDPVVVHPPCHLWVNFAAQNYARATRPCPTCDGTGTDCGQCDGTCRREPNRAVILPAWYPGGNDGGCFASALASVRRCGGVLEHPAGSHAWAHYDIDRPWSAPPGWYYNMGPHDGPEWVCEVWQSAYGHRARKRTWLLYCGKRPPFELNWAREPGTHQVGWFDRAKPTLSKCEASATPEAFARELIRLAEWSRGAP